MLDCGSSNVSNSLSQSRCFLGDEVSFVSVFCVSERLPEVEKTTNKPVGNTDGKYTNVSVYQQEAKMLGVLSLFFLYTCCPAGCVFQRLYCTISDSCDCDFKPNIRGKLSLSRVYANASSCQPSRLTGQHNKRFVRLTKHSIYIFLH